MKAIASIILTALCLVAIALACATAVVPSPLYADPNYHGSCDPEVVWNPASEEWFIYYTARRAKRETHIK